MAATNGTLRDKTGKSLYPATSADKVICTALDGSVQSLHDVLADVGLAPMVISEETLTLQGGLNPGDLYQVTPYIVGSKRIQLWADGDYLPQGADGMWEEYGNEGETSNIVRVLGNVNAGSKLTVRVGDSTGRSLAVMADFVVAQLSSSGSRSAVVTAGSDFTVPEYVVGSGRLQIWMDGLLCMAGDDPALHTYKEVGPVGGVSTVIQFHQDIGQSFEIYTRALTTRAVVGTSQQMPLMPDAASVLLSAGGSRGDVIAAGSDFTVPDYVVGSNRLQVFMDGLLCMAGNDPDIHTYQEVEVADGLSNIIRFHEEVPVRFEIFARVL